MRLSDIFSQSESAIDAKMERLHHNNVLTTSALVAQTKCVGKNGRIWVMSDIRRSDMESYIVVKNHGVFKFFICTAKEVTVGTESGFDFQSTEVPLLLENGIYEPDFTKGKFSIANHRIRFSPKRDAFFAEIVGEGDRLYFTEMDVEKIFYALSKVNLLSPPPSQLRSKNL